MFYIMLALCAVTFTTSVFLVAKFGIKRKESSEFISDNKLSDNNL